MLLQDRIINFESFHETETEQFQDSINKNGNVTKGKWRKIVSCVTMRSINQLQIIFKRDQANENDINLEFTSLTSKKMKVSNKNEKDNWFDKRYQENEYNIILECTSVTSKKMKVWNTNEKENGFGNNIEELSNLLETVELSTLMMQSFLKQYRFCVNMYQCKEVLIHAYSGLSLYPTSEHITSYMYVCTALSLFSRLTIVS